MKQCTGACKTEQAICDEYDPEPSEIGDRGQTIFSGFCLVCGHSEECHEEIGE